MLPLYLARIGDLRQGEFVKIDCASCHHVAVLTREFLLRLGLSPDAKVLDLKWRATLPVRASASAFLPAESQYSYRLDLECF